MSQAVPRQAPEDDDDSVRLRPTLRATLMFRPYGTALLTRPAAIWLAISMMLVFIMASTEALAWGRLFSRLAPGPAGWGIGLTVAAAVFAIIWALDATLMTLDRAAAEHVPVIYHQRSKPGTLANKVRAWWKQHGQRAAGVMLRILFVAGSMLLTAPFLADMMFSNEIEQIMEEQRRDLLRGHREAMATPSPQEVRQSRKVDAGREAYFGELGGTDGTGTIGNGPVAREKKAVLLKQEERLRELEKARLQELAAFDEAVVAGDDGLLQTRWHLSPPSGTVVDRQAALDILAGRETFKRADWTIKGFLVMIFSSLLALKWFEPRSVRLYLSGALQSEWIRYVAGHHDYWMRPSECHQARRSMTPYRFEELLLTVYPSLRDLDDATGSIELRQERFRTMRHELRMDIEALGQEEQRTHDAVLDALKETRSAQGDVEDQEASLLRLAEATQDRVQVSTDEERVLMLRIEQARRHDVAKADSDLRAARAHNEVCTRILQRAQAAHEKVTRRLADRQDRMDEIDAQLHALGQELAEAHGRWPQHLRVDVPDQVAADDQPTVVMERSLATNARSEGANILQLNRS